MSIFVKDLPIEYKNEKFHENEFLVPNNNYNLLLRHREGMIFHIGSYSQNVFGLGPKERNLEQKFAWNLLTDNSISIVNLVGRFGTGKTFLALLAGLAQLEQFPDCGYEKLFDSIMVITPTVPVDSEHDLGLLPGEKFEKIRPWVGSIFDNFKAVLRLGNMKTKVFRKKSDKKNISNSNDDDNQDFRKRFEQLCNNGVIEFENINYIRGRSLHGYFIIVDEAQDFTDKEIKLIGGRVAQQTKIAILGNPYNVNRLFLREDINGLTYAVEALKNGNYKEAGSVVLKKVERSRVSEIFDEI